MQLRLGVGGWGLFGFGVWGLGLGLWGLAWGLGFGVWGLNREEMIIERLKKLSQKAWGLGLGFRFRVYV